MNLVGAPIPSLRLGLNRAELAMAIGVSPNSIDQMVEEGMLPRPRKWHKRKIWIIAEVHQAMLEWPEDEKASAEEVVADKEWRATA